MKTAHEGQEEIFIGDVDAHWHLIVDGLTQISEENDTDWTPEDMRGHLRVQRAHLYITDDGFVILERGQNSFTGETFLFSPAAYSKSNIGAEKYTATFEQLARDVGASYIEMWSKRAGWQRVSGWDKAYTCYRRRI